jgi:Cd2+/Zn2+-exporting ATPase
MVEKLKLELPLLLPDVPSEEDQCVEHLIAGMRDHRGVEDAHVDLQDDQPRLCLHYDPNVLSLADVRRLAEQAGAGITRRFAHETLPVAGMDCADCAGSIEHILQRLSGIVTVSVSYAAERMRVEYDTEQVTRAEIITRIRWMGYDVPEEKPRGWFARHREIVLAVCCGLLLAIGFFGEWVLSLPRTAAMIFYAAAYAAGGFDAARHGLKAALKLRLDIDVLMVLAAAGAALLGAWAEGALLLFLFSLGHSLEHYALDRARRAIASLADIAPRTALVQRDGREQEVPVEELQRGDIVVVRPDVRIPTDGIVVSGTSSVDQSPVTGESIPADKRPVDDAEAVGDWQQLAAEHRVFAGTINGSGVLKVQVARRATETTLARVVEMVSEAQTQKSPTQLFTQRFEAVFVPSVLGFALLLLFAPVVVDESFRESFYRAMAVLVASSPCALAIATPAAVLSAVARAGRGGVLLKGGAPLENLARLRSIAFDKTGTITEGRPRVTDVVPFEDAPETELLSVASAVERLSDHPLARAVVRHGTERTELQIPAAGELERITGLGVSAVVDGKPVHVGKDDLFAAVSGPPLPDRLRNAVVELEERGRTTMIVRLGDRYLGVIGLMDTPRDGAREVIEQLRRIGTRRMVMISGDNQRVASAVADEVGLDEARGGLMPEDKVETIRLLRSEGDVAMVGDGVNDAPAMALATVGIAMGAAGSDVALETADVALMSDRLDHLPFAVGLSRQAGRVIRQNLWLSVGIVAVLLPATVFGLGIGPAVAVHEGSTLLVVFNALRLLTYRV